MSNVLPDLLQFLSAGSADSGAGGFLFFGCIVLLVSSYLPGPGQITVAEHRGFCCRVEERSSGDGGQGIHGHRNRAVHSRQIGNLFRQSEYVDLEGPPDHRLGKDIHKAGEHAGEDCLRIHLTACLRSCQVQNLMGHTDAKSTAIYTELSMRKKTRVVDAHGPLAKIRTPVSELLKRLPG